MYRSLRCGSSLASQLPDPRPPASFGMRWGSLPSMRMDFLGSRTSRCTSPWVWSTPLQLGRPGQLGDSLAGLIGALFSFVFWAWPLASPFPPFGPPSWAFGARGFGSRGSRRCCGPWCMPTWRAVVRRIRWPKFKGSSI